MKFKPGYRSEPMRVRMPCGTQAAIHPSVRPSGCMISHLYLSACIRFHLSVCLSGCFLVPSGMVHHGCPFWIQNPNSTHRVLPRSSPSSLIPEERLRSCGPGIRTHSPSVGVARRALSAMM